MAKTPAEFEKEFMATAKEATGKTLEQWLAVVKTSGMEKTNDIIAWLKKEHGLNHLQAQLTTGIYLNNGQPVYSNENALLDNQFAKCPDMRSLFDTLSGKITVDFPGTQVIPKKTYISFTAVREFAAMNIKPGEIRMGIDLGDEPFTDAIQKSKLTGPMPRISHMVILTDAGQYDNKAKEILQRSYNRCHKK